MIVPSASVCSRFPLPKTAGEYRDDSDLSAPDVRAIKALGMSTGSAASPLASRPWRKMTVIWALLFGLAHSAFAEVILGRVVGVSDGDTITVLTREHKQIKVRLASIDAPESHQAFGQASKQSLAAMVFNHLVQVEYQKKDRYGRLVGKVTINAQDVCLTQIERGLAWHYKQYEREQPVDDRASYAQAEVKARDGHLGLWKDQSPVPPWEFRKGGRRQR